MEVTTETRKRMIWWIEVWTRDFMKRQKSCERESGWTIERPVQKSRGKQLPLPQPHCSKMVCQFIVYCVVTTFLSLLFIRYDHIGAPSLPLGHSQRTDLLLDLSLFFYCRAVGARPKKKETVLSSVPKKLLPHSHLWQSSRRLLDIQSVQSSPIKNKQTANTKTKNP